MKWYVVGAIALWLAMPCVARAESAEQAASETLHRSGVPDGPIVLFGGCGGAYLLAEPGELTVEVFKQDRNRRGAAAELRAILAGPDRRVLQEVRIPDDGKARGSGPGPLQSARLSAAVERAGVYALNVTVSNDRYGAEMAWGLRTNCPRYMIETSRGHKDERHQEPLVLASPDRPVDVCFHPRRESLSFEISGLPKEVKEIQLFDSRGELLRTAAVDGKGAAAGRFPAEAARDHIPWRLHLPKAQAVIDLDGLTRWTAADLCPDACCWSPSVKAWLPLLENRWLLTPYSRTVFGQPGEVKRIAFRVDNNERAAKTVRLGLEFPEGPWPARLDKTEVKLAGKRSVEVEVTCTAPPAGQARICHVRAQPVKEPGFTTYSTITVVAAPSPASKPLHLPLMLKPYEHENEQLGYLPEYPAEWEPYFDLHNRPFVRTSRAIKILRDGRWRDGRSAETPFSASRSNTKVAFDRNNDVYAITVAGGRASLLHSADGGRTFAAYDLGRPGGLDIEQFSGHNVPDGPPAILRSIRTAQDPKLRWRTLSDLELILAEKRDGRLVIGQPILLSRKSLGVGAHSGVPSAVVSRGPRVHIVWAEATDPAENAPGVPTYVATYDREQRKLLGEPVLVGYGAPPNDVHNRPCIVMDSRGRLHVLTGTHGRPFQYAMSLQPNTAHAGWTAAETVGEGLSQTYIGMVCGKDDTLHLVFRLWRRGLDPFPLSTHATLAYQRKRPGQPWEEPRILVVAPFSEYSIFYHRLTIDRLGRLFLSYDYWSTYWFYRNDHFGDRRALMMSADDGETWKLVQPDDFVVRN